MKYVIRFSLEYTEVCDTDTLEFERFPRSLIYERHSNDHYENIKVVNKNDNWTSFVHMEVEYVNNVVIYDYNWFDKWLTTEGNNRIFAYRKGSSEIYLFVDGNIYLIKDHLIYAVAKQGGKYYIFTSSGRVTELDSNMIVSSGVTLEYFKRRILLF